MIIRDIKLHDIHDSNHNISDVVVNNMSLVIHSDPLIDFRDITLAQINAVATTIFPYIVGLDRDRILSILEKAYHSVQGQYTIQDAVSWAEGFVMPPEVHSTDFRELAMLGFDLPELIRRKQARNKHSRLSIERLERLWDHSDPDYDLLCEFAREGVHVMTSHNFVPRRAKPSEFSPKYSIAYPAVNKLIYDSYVADLAVILPSNCIARLPANIPIHQSRLGHTLKKGKPQGRVTCNYSYGLPRSRLNTDEVRERAREQYGDIMLSTVTDMALMILKQLDFAKEAGRSSRDLVLWKMDLKGAFTLLFFRPIDCGLLVLPMTDDLSYIPIAGNFGLTIFPFIFNVISRVLDRAIKALIWGLICWYIDDIQGCCLKEHVDDDIATASEVIVKLLGNDSVAHDKTEKGRVIDWIGWQFDLDTMTVSIADHNYYKTLYGFLVIRRGQRVKVSTLHTLASWASRYSSVCIYMTPFSGYLYSAFSGYENPEVEIVLPETAYLVILLWRVFLFLMKLDLKAFARPIEDFRPWGEPQYLLEVDGSPIGVGFFIHKRVYRDVISPETIYEWECIFTASLCDVYDLNNDSRYQNSMEFIASIMGMACLAYLGIHNKRIEILGDNITSLVWLEALKFRPGASTAAAFAYITLIKHCGYKVVSTEHKEGTLNRADPLSRRDTSAMNGRSLSRCMTKKQLPPVLRDLSSWLNPSENIMEETALLERMSNLNSASRHLSTESRKFR